MRSRGAGAAAALVVALLAAGCSSGSTGTKPTFGGGEDAGGSSSAGASTTELARLKASADIGDCPTSDVAAAPADDALPDLTLDCLGGGRAVNLSGLAGTPTIVNLWASWCEPCRKELPLLARAAREYDGKVRVIGIDVADAAPEAALRLAASSDVTYPLLVDRDGRTRAPLRVAGLPQTVFVDAQGRMVSTERAPFRSYADITAAISRHLGVAP